MMMTMYMAFLQPRNSADLVPANQALSINIRRNDDWLWKNLQGSDSHTITSDGPMGIGEGGPEHVNNSYPIRMISIIRLL
jgi:hypothetical protein